MDLVNPYLFTNSNKNTKKWHYCNIGAYLNMNNLVAIAILATLSTTPSFASSLDCEALKEQCENAAKLKNAATPYVSMIWKGAQATYWKTHGHVKGLIPTDIVAMANPVINEAAFRNYATHLVLSLCGYGLAQGVLAFLSVPFSIATLPFRNWATGLVTGVVAKSLYDANSREAEANN